MLSLTSYQEGAFDQVGTLFQAGVVGSKELDLKLRQKNTQQAVFHVKQFAGYFREIESSSISWLYLSVTHRSLDAIFVMRFFAVGNNKSRHELQPSGTAGVRGSLPFPTLRLVRVPMNLAGPRWRHLVEPENAESAARFLLASKSKLHRACGHRVLMSSKHSEGCRVESRPAR